MNHPLVIFRESVCLHDTLIPRIPTEFPLTHSLVGGTALRELEVHSCKLVASSPALLECLPDCSNQPGKDTIVFICTGITMPCLLISGLTPLSSKGIDLPTDLACFVWFIIYPFKEQHLTHLVIFALKARLLRFCHCSWFREPFTQRSPDYHPVFT